MEVVGDSTLVGDVQVEKPSTPQLESIEFERNLDNFEESLNQEENRLLELEEQRKKLKQEIDELWLEIADEKKIYRKALDNVISTHELLSRAFIESCKTVDVSPNSLSTSLLEVCVDTVASNKKANYNIDEDFDKIGSDLMEQIFSIKTNRHDHLQQK